MMTVRSNTPLLEKLLKPVVRFCLAHSLQLPDVVEALKRVFVSLAAEDLTRAGYRENTSRISAVTGIQRKEIDRISRNDSPPASAASVITKVIGAWQFNPRFSDSFGKPRNLTSGNSDSEFAELVHSVSSDLHSGTILFELERVNAVTKLPDGTISLRATAFVPKDDQKNGMELLGNDIDDLFRAGFENISGSSTIPNLHAKTTFDRISAEHKEKVKRWFLQEGKKLHDRARVFLAKLDQDSCGEQGDNSDPAGYIRASIGTFSYIESVQSERTVSR